MPDRRRWVLTIALAAGIVTSSAATAGWQDGATASLPVGSGSLVAATGLAAAPGCVLVTHRVTLTWTPTVSTSAVGYRIYRRVGAGSFALLTTVAGRTTSTYADTLLAASTTYTYYVEAYVGAWTAVTANASATTNPLCLA